eukprot:3349980-Rhodomonas_salina.2
MMWDQVRRHLKCRKQHSAQCATPNTEDKTAFRLPNQVQQKQHSCGDCAAQLVACLCLRPVPYESAKKIAVVVASRMVQLTAQFTHPRCAVPPWRIWCCPGARTRGGSAPASHAVCGAEIVDAPSSAIHGSSTSLPPSGRTTGGLRAL